MDPNERSYGNFNNDRFQHYNDRNYPTTPSTFPQPVFETTGGVGGYGQQPAGNNYAGAGGYFMNNPYPSPYQKPQGYQNYHPSTQASYRPSPLAYNNNNNNNNGNDGADGLVHQFAHQNLGPTARQAMAYPRQPSPAPRTKPTGTSGQPSYGTHLNPTTPSFSLSGKTKEGPPEKTPDILPEMVKQRGNLCREYASNFFKQSLNRARERNERQVEFEKFQADPTVPTARKEQKREQMRKAEVDHLRFLRAKEAPQNFTTLKVIGKGAFGEVKLVQKKTDGKIYALKSLVKTEMLKKDQLAHVRAERDILAESDSPWVVKLFATFQDSTFLYMLMEFLPGGDLMTMLIKYEIFSEDITRFYIAEIVLAIEAVHQLGFIHRDIKPDNILLDKDGHIKLTDFGLSTGFHKLHDNSYYQQLLVGKSSKPRDRNSVSLDQINLTVSNRGQINTWRKSRRVLAYSTVGTPDYIAPEIFSGQGYTFDCDWWSLGTIMFECLVGWPPFCSDDQHDTYRKIVNWKKCLYFPRDIRLGPEAEHLIRSLICDPLERLGHGGVSEIKGHPFFRGVIFEHLRRIEAPFKPKLKSNIDFTYFPVEDIDQSDNTAELRREAQQQSQASAAQMEMVFQNYTFKRFDT
ncbi:MAG: Serine/threonine-protein kinase [Peltula sp. TS41687]|nr:MAG: Serine/threonine-protein kinase [Peltula sp. TS41687]